MVRYTRRDFLTMLAGGASAFALNPAANLASAFVEHGYVNVLFIAVDDLRPELGCYGHPMIKSPNIDRLADTGMIFTRAYCQQAICAPSRSSLLSGCRPDTTGIYDLKTPLREAMPDVLSLPQHFRNNGHQTISLGKIYHHGNDDEIGWCERPKTGGKQYCLEENQKYVRERTVEAKELELTGTKRYNYTRADASESADVPDNAYPDGAMTDKAIEMLQKHKDRAFFLATGFKKPHLPFNCPKKYWDMYDRDEIQLPDTSQPAGAPRYALTNWGELRSYRDIPEEGDLDEAKTRELIHGYYACVSYIDAQIGRILDELDRLNLRRNTAIILWGDHGWKLGEYGDWCKHTNFELDTHAPMILSAPGMVGGQECHALTEFVDIYPTLAELCGLKIPEHCEGLSMVPLLTDPGQRWKTAAFSQYPRSWKGIMGYSLRTERWRYTEWIEQETGEAAARELYDHAKNPFAYTNVVDEQEHAELVRQLAAMMKAGWRGALPGE